MSEPSGNLREQGLAALRAQRVDEAVDLLARAVMADDRDVEAKALLGVAYSQKGMHDQAKRALLTATAVAPTNANYLFNLGAVLERAGERPAAFDAYRRALQVEPNHAQTRNRLKALGPEGQAVVNQAASGGQPYGQQAPPPMGGPPIGGPGQGEPGSGVPQGQPFPPPGQQPSPYGQQPSPYGQQQQPYGQQPSPYGQPPSPYGQQPSPHQQLPGAPGATAETDYVEDRFDLLQSLKDWGRILFSPAGFYRSQGNTEGLKSMMSFLCVYCGIYGLILLLLMQRTDSPAMRNPAIVIGSFLGIFVVVLLTTLIVGGMLHLASRILGGDGAFSDTWRITTYAQAPTPLVLLFAGIITMVMPSGSAPSEVARPNVAPRLAAAQARPGLLAVQAPGQPFPGAGMGQPGGRPVPGQRGGPPGMGGQTGPTNRSGADVMAMQQQMQREFFQRFGLDPDYQRKTGQTNPITLLSLPWILVLTGMGLAAVHGFSAGRAIGALLLGLLGWVALCCVCVLGPAIVLPLMNAARRG